MRGYPGNETDRSSCGPLPADMQGSMGSDFLYWTSRSAGYAFLGAAMIVSVGQIFF